MSSRAASGMEAMCCLQAARVAAAPSGSGRAERPARGGIPCCRAEWQSLLSRTCGGSKEVAVRRWTSRRSWGKRKARSASDLGGIRGAAFLRRRVGAAVGRGTRVATSKSTASSNQEQSAEPTACGAQDSCVA